MTDKSSGKQSTTVSKEVTTFLKDSSYWAAGGMACWLKYNAMKTIVRQRMVTGGPAYIFAVMFGALAYKGMKTARDNVKGNGKTMAKNIYNLKIKKSGGEE